MHHNVDIEMDVHLDRDASTCAITYRAPGMERAINVVGSAKRHPKDEPQHLIGELLATSRAVYRLADQMALQAIAEMGLSREEMAGMLNRKTWRGDDDE
jgi:hypothetical protein